MALHDASLPPWRARVEDVLITGELRYRVPRTGTSQAKTRAKIRLLDELATHRTLGANDLLDKLVSSALELCHAGAAGISLLVHSADGEPLLRWEKVRGALARYTGCTSPRHYSASGTTLDRHAPQLFLYPGRCFHHLTQRTPAIVEALVIPIYVEEAPWGTMWVVSHEEHRNFDRSDVDVISSLAEFTVAAIGGRTSAAPAG